MIVDFHAHYMTPALAEALRGRRDPPWIEETANGDILHLPIGRLAFTPDYIDMVARIAFMDRLGIDRQVLSFPGLFGLDSLPATECEPLLRAFNDATSSLCRAQPDRFSGLAAVLVADMGRAIAEYRRARGELGLHGVILPVNGFVSIEQAERFAPLLDAVARLGGYVFLHPGRRADEVPPPGTPARAYPYPDNVLARQALAVQHQVAGCMVTLLLSDFLDRWPDLPVQVANLGGTLPMVLERIDHAVALRDPDAPTPSAGAHRVHVDCASLGTRAIEIAVATFGADRVLFGTDCPIFSTRRSLDAVRDAALTADQRRAILETNAGALLGG